MGTNLYTNTWLGLNPGKLRHRVDIQESTATQDATGLPIPAWAALYSAVEAFVEPLSGDELFNARQLHAAVTHRVSMRYRSGITPVHRILFGTRVFDILSALDIQERNQLIEIMAKERL